MIAVFGKANIGLGAMGEVMIEAHASHRLNAKCSFEFHVDQNDETLYQFFAMIFVIIAD